MDNEFERQLREELIRAENDLSPALTKQLDTARWTALNSYQKPWAVYLQKALWPSVGMATASLLILMVMLNPVSPFYSVNKVLVESQNADNGELLEDLDFYYWLSENEAELRG